MVLFVYEQIGAGSTGPIAANPTPTEEEKKTKLVVVAKAPLEQFTRITEAFVEVRERSENMELPKDYVIAPEEIIEKEVIEEIYKGEMITLPRLQDPNEGQTGISRFLGEGERAITILVDAISASGGFIQQGDIVDVYARFPDPETNDERVQIVLRNIKIMAVGGDYRRRLRKNADQRISTLGQSIRITLAVASQLANKIKHLGSTTPFGLLLKNPKDNSDSDTEGWAYSKLLAENVPPEALPPPEKTQLKYNVSVIRGLSESIEEIEIDVEEETDFY